MYPLFLNPQQTADIVTPLESKSRRCTGPRGSTTTTNNPTLSRFSALEFLLKDPSTAQQWVWRWPLDLRNYILYISKSSMPIQPVVWPRNQIGCPRLEGIFISLYQQKVTTMIFVGLLCGYQHTVISVMDVMDHRWAKLHTAVYSHKGFTPTIEVISDKSHRLSTLENLEAWILPSNPLTLATLELPKSDVAISSQFDTPRGDCPPNEQLEGYSDPHCSGYANIYSRYCNVWL